MITVDTPAVMRTLCEYIKQRRVPAYTRIATVRLPDMAYDIIDALLKEFVRVSGILADGSPKSKRSALDVGSLVKSSAGVGQVKD
jgi:hypothetical protein